MSIYRVVYASQPFGFDQGMLNGILSDARRCNERDGITGALICRADLYLQWLEGTEPTVRATYGRIEQDSRHVNVRCLLEGPSVQRLFPDWAMRDDPARSWMWTSDQVSDGAIERATRADLIRIFERVAADPA